MRKLYSQALYRQFEHEVKARWPQFKKSKQRPALGRAYVWALNDIGNVFLFLRLDPKGKECFYCEFGWSRVSDFPQKEWFDYRFPILDAGRAFREPEMIEGIQVLWGDHGTGAWRILDPVDTFRPLDYASCSDNGAQEFARRLALQSAMTEREADALLRPVTQELIEKLTRYVIPYLAQYIEYARSSLAAK